MKPKIPPLRSPELLPLALAFAHLTVDGVHAQLLVYEGFQYEEIGNELIGKPDDFGGTDAIGLAGTWQDAAPTGGEGNDMFLKDGNLQFGDLAGSGNHIGFKNNLNHDIYHRELSNDAQEGLGTTTEIWFSFLVEKLQNNFSAGEGGFALTNQVLATPRIFENGGSSELNGLIGFGAGPTTAGNDWTAYLWDGTTKLTGDATIPMPPANGTSNTGESNLGDVRLIIGQIELDLDAEGTDRYTLFNYELSEGSVTGGSLVAIASPLEAIIDQTVIDTLNLTRQVNLNWDEIRIGTSLESVLDSAPNAAPQIVSIGYTLGDELLTLSWSSREGESYTVRYSRDLSNWDNSIDGSVEADPGETTSHVFDISGLTPENGRLFFRVERN